METYECVCKGVYTNLSVSHKDHLLYTSTKGMPALQPWVSFHLVHSPSSNKLGAGQCNQCLWFQRYGQGCIVFAEVHWEPVYPLFWADTLLSSSRHLPQFWVPLLFSLSEPLLKMRCRVLNHLAIFWQRFSPTLFNLSEKLGRCWCSLF